MFSWFEAVTQIFGAVFAPMKILLLPVVRVNPALAPSAIFELPIVLPKSALDQRATFDPHVVLLKSAFAPTAVFVVMLPPPRPTCTPFSETSSAESRIKSGSVLPSPTFPSLVS